MDWTRGRTIGRGSTATVSVAAIPRSGQVLAVKSVEFSRSEVLERERTILSALNCPHIIAYKGYDMSSEDGKLLCNLFMEYAAGGSIADAMAADGGCLNEATVQCYTRELLLGLEYLHSNGVVHCDIKCHNILVAEEGIKLADFGCARRVQEVSGGSFAGTPIFMAPEVARGEHQGFPADVWAVGCTVIQMLTGKAPWADFSDPVAAIYRIGSGEESPETPSFMSEQGKDFLRRCLIRDPEERWSVGELLKHPFLCDLKMKSPAKQNLKSDLETPTSILERGFWDSVNDSETTHGPNQQKVFGTPLQRIQQLSQVAETRFRGISTWEWREDWITVRSNADRSDCFQITKLPCSSESIATNKGGRNGVDDQDCFSISIRIRDLPMAAVGRKSVTLETINSSNNEKLFIVFSFCVVQFSVQTPSFYGILCLIGILIFGRFTSFNPKVSNLTLLFLPLTISNHFTVNTPTPIIKKMILKKL